MKRMILMCIVLIGVLLTSCSKIDETAVELKRLSRLWKNL